MRLAVAGYTLKINNWGEVVWDWDDIFQRLVYLYSNGQVRQLSADSPAMILPINDKGEATWQKNYSEQGNVIFLYSGGGETILLSQERNPQIPKINNRSQVLWTADGSTNPLKSGLTIYNRLNQTSIPVPTTGDDLDSGQVTQVTPGATSSFGSPDITERGQIVFTGYDEVIGGGTFLATPGNLPPVNILLLD